jgi:hypothetical protein
MLKPKFNKDYIRKELQKQRQVIASDVVRICSFVGEKFVVNARSSLQIDPSAFPEGDYTDRTGNLRSSIGYAVIADGEVQVLHLPENGEARNYLSEVIASLPWAKGVRLIGEAGMDYASYLESMGYNVISSQADVAIVDLSKILEKYAKQKGISKLLND